MATLPELLRQMVEIEGSDLHITTATPPQVRVHGELKRLDGAGMTPDVQRQAFDPFFTTRRNEGGTGLGLHIVYNLVTQQLGGRMMLESRLGQGTTFRIIMPKVARGEPTITDQTAADGTSQWPNRTMSST